MCVYLILEKPWPAILFLFIVHVRSQIHLVQMFKCGDKTLDHHYSFMYPHHNSSVLQTLSFYLFVLDCSVWMYGVRSETKGEPVLIFWHLIMCLHISSIELEKYWTLQWIHCVPERHSNYYWIRLLLFYAETEKKERGGWNSGRPAGRSYFVSFQRTFSS